MEPKVIGKFEGNYNWDTAIYKYNGKERYSMNFNKEIFDGINEDYSEIDPEYGGRAQSKRVVMAQKVFAPRREIISIPKSTIEKIW